MITASKTANVITSPYKNFTVPLKKESWLIWTLAPNWWVGWRWDPISEVLTNVYIMTLSKMSLFFKIQWLCKLVDCFVNISLIYSCHNTISSTDFFFFCSLNFRAAAGVIDRHLGRLCTLGVNKLHKHCHVKVPCVRIKGKNQPNFATCFDLQVMSPPWID